MMKKDTQDVNFHFCGEGKSIDDDEIRVLDENWGWRFEKEKEWVCDETVTVGLNCQSLIGSNEVYNRCEYTQGESTEQ